MWWRKEKRKSELYQKEDHDLRYFLFEHPEIFHYDVTYLYGHWNAA
jgi:hypothetical protein